MPYYKRFCIFRTLFIFRNYKRKQRSLLVNADSNAQAVSLWENDEIDQRVSARTRELLTM